MSKRSSSRFGITKAIPIPSLEDQARELEIPSRKLFDWILNRSFHHRQLLFASDSNLTEELLGLDQFGIDDGPFTARLVAALFDEFIAPQDLLSAIVRIRIPRIGVGSARQFFRLLIQDQFLAIGHPLLHLENVPGRKSVVLHVKGRGGVGGGIIGLCSKKEKLWSPLHGEVFGFAVELDTETGPPIQKGELT